MCLINKKNQFLDSVWYYRQNQLEDDIEIQKILKEKEHLVIPDGILDEIYRNIMREIKST